MAEKIATELDYKCVTVLGSVRQHTDARHPEKSKKLLEQSES